MSGVYANSLSARVTSIPAKDDISKNCNTSDILQARNQKQSNISG